MMIEVHRCTSSDSPERSSELHQPATFKIMLDLLLNSLVLNFIRLDLYSTDLFMVSFYNHFNCKKKKKGKEVQNRFFSFFFVKETN